MLRTALANIHDAGSPLRFAPPQAQAPDIARLLVERYGANAEPRQSANSLQALLRRLRLARFEWDKVGPADRLDVAWVLWEGTAPPAEHEAFLHDFLQWVEMSQRRLQAARLAASWAVAFDPDLRSIRVIGDWLMGHAAWLPDPWPRLAHEFEIFSVANGPAGLAESFLAGEETAASFFQRLRLPARAAAGGLALEALAAAASCVEHRLAREPRLAARLCDLSLHGTAFRPDATMGSAPARGRAVRRALAETLLSSWQQQAPPPDVKARIVAYLLRHYGDPRVTREHWAEMRAPALAIMRRWLTERTVAIYFRLAGAAKSAAREQLAGREKFWMSRLEQIDDAWLLAGPRSIPMFGSDQPAHGSLIGCAPDQSALLLRVGGMTVLESSHEASETVWLPGNPLAPPLYRRKNQPYGPAALSNGADFSSAFSHRGNDTWQERLAQFIDRRCGDGGVAPQAATARTVPAAAPLSSRATKSRGTAPAREIVVDAVTVT